jgi:hypothetical protein
MTRVLELNDTALRLADASGIRASSPGYAVVSERRLLVGDAARREARLDPRHTTSQFWQRLSMDPVQHPNPAARTLADLAHAHLMHVWESVDEGAGDGEVILAVPGHYGRDQLALVLGIARECPFTPVGLVDAAVAATAEVQPEAAEVVHVDALLHQAVLTRLEGREAWVREAVSDVPALGLAGLRDAWVHQIADAFIRETRFDPLHDAGVEQRLHDGLDGWIDALSSADETTAELEANGHVYRVDLVRSRLVEKVAPRYAALRTALTERVAGGTPVLLAPALARLPGLVEELARGGWPVTVLDPAATVRGALTHEAAIRDDGEALRFVTRLPRASRPARAPEPAAPEPPPSVETPPPAAEAVPATDAVVTHVLLDDVAWPLTGDTVTVGGADGLGGEALPERLATLRRDGDHWVLEPEGRGHPGPLAPGESRLLGPERVLLTLIRVVGRDG